MSEPIEATTSVTEPAPRAALMSYTASSAVEFVALPEIVLAKVTVMLVPLYVIPMLEFQETSTPEPKLVPVATNDVLPLCLFNSISASLLPAGE